jgi:hypothetical protein
MSSGVWSFESCVSHPELKTRDARPQTANAGRREIGAGTKAPNFKRIEDLPEEIRHGRY